MNVSDVAQFGTKWLGVYVIHSTCIIGVLWVVFKKFTQLSHATKDLLLKTTLIVNVVASSVYCAYPYFTQWMFAAADESTNNTVVCATTLANAQGAPVIPSWVMVVFTGWGLIALILGLRFYWHKHQFLHSLSYLNISAPALETATQALANKVYIKHPIKLRFIANALSPMVLNKNTILVPEQALKHLNVPQQHSMLAHELAHIKRRDDVWLWICQLHQVLFFFQPLNHWLIQELREVTEQICDAEAVQMTQDQQALAQCLVEVAGWLNKTPRWVAAMAAGKHQLKQRINHILNSKPMNNTKKRSRKSPFIIAGAMTLASMLAIFVLSGVPLSQAQSVVASNKKVTKKTNTKQSPQVLHCEASVKQQYLQAVKQQNKTAQKALKEQMRRDAFARSIFLFPAKPKPRTKKGKAGKDDC